MPQQIAISGHTDATQFVSDTGYSNWELSADRANDARRVLKDLGVPGARVARVVGRASTEPLLPDDPTNARNRRLSIVLLRGTGQQQLPADAGASEAPQPAPVPQPQPAPAPQPPQKAVPQSSSPLWDNSKPAKKSGSGVTINLDNLNRLQGQ